MKILFYTDNHFCERYSVIDRQGKKYTLRLENQLESINWVEKLAQEKCCQYILVLILLVTIAPVCPAQVCSCTDSLALNFNPMATLNDGSCQYASTIIMPVEIGALDSQLGSTSSLFYWENGYWTNNDHNDSCLYLIDTTTAETVGSRCFDGVYNYDTEEITQDSLYLYFGDFGNNRGNRKNLRILRVSKESLENKVFQIDTIRFSYEDQTDFTARLNATDFDCEAFIVTDDSIYLFTKQWVSAQTTVYSLPKTPGAHVAHRRDTYNTKGLITGVTYIPEYQLVVLCGYDYDKNHILSALHPFLILLYDFKDGSFFSGNKWRLDFPSGTKAQIEGIATSNGLDFYLTSEHFHTTRMGLTFDFPAQLWRVDLRKYLLPYMKSKSKND